MGSMSIMHWVIVLVVVLLLFGAGRVSNIMKEMGKGVRGFKEGLSGKDEPKSGSDDKLTPPGA